VKFVKVYAYWMVLKLLILLIDPTLIHYHTIHQGLFMILSWEIDSSFSPSMHKALNVWIRCKIEGYVFFMVRWSIVTSACLQWPILMREMRPNSVSWEKSLKKRIIKLDNRHMEDCVREVNGGSFFLPERSIMFGDSFLSGSYPVIFLSSFTADSTTYLILFFLTYFNPPSDRGPNWQGW